MFITAVFAALCFAFECIHKRYGLEACRGLGALEALLRPRHDRLNDEGGCFFSELVFAALLCVFKCIHGADTLAS